MGVSENRVVLPPNHPFSIGFSIIFTILFLGYPYPYFWKHPYQSTRLVGLRWSFEHSNAISGYPCNKNIVNKHQLLFLMNGGVSLASPFLNLIFNKLTFSWIDCDSGHFEHFAHHCYHLAYITCLSIFDEDYDVHIQREEVCTRSSDCSWAHTKEFLDRILM